MKKNLSFFLVALVVFTFMGCDSSSKVPTEDQAAEIGNVFAAFTYVVNSSEQGVSSSSDGNTRTLTEDIDSDEFTFKAGSYMSYTTNGVTLDVKYVKGGNHSLYMVGSYSEAGYNFSECVWDDVSYDINSFFNSQM